MELTGTLTYTVEPVTEGGASVVREIRREAGQGMVVKRFNG